MTTQGRSLDDLPLAAYTTGMRPDQRLEELEALDDDDTKTAGNDSLATATAIASADAGEGQTAAGPGPGGSFDPARAEALALEGEPIPGVKRSMPGLPIPKLPIWLANPRANPRDPRLLMTGVIGFGVVLLVASLALGGGQPAGAAGPDASPSARPVVGATVPPPTGDATVEVSGKVAGAFTLTGTTGTGPASDGRIAVTWMDASGSSLVMTGAASPGTRTTDAAFSLTWTTLLNGAPIAFPSATGECTVGMALQAKTVTGSFVCKKLKSTDGKLTIDVKGTYRT